ncbi:hypothetical protein [Rudaea sp.]|uniref:hypothetical protein n=1 Tax=Rudaea sp. TaxID=2136325 RepID=UPI002ED2C198
MSAECTFKSESAGAAASAATELGKLAPPAVRAGVLLASIANNVMANPRNAAIVAVLIVVALPLYLYWKRRRSAGRAMLESLCGNGALAMVLRDAHRAGTPHAATADRQTRAPRRAAHAIPARIGIGLTGANGDNTCIATASNATA